MRRAIDAEKVRIGDRVCSRFGKGTVWEIVGYGRLHQPYPGSNHTRRLRLRSVTSGRVRYELAWNLLPAGERL